MSNQAIIDHLNEILKHEWTGVAQYSQASFIVEGVWREVYSGKFIGDAKESFNHAQLIGEKIVALGGVPVATRNEIKQSRVLQEVLEFSLAFEAKAVEMYGQAIDMAEGNKALVIFLEDILTQEQEGVDEYTKLSGSYQPGVITGKPVGAGGSAGRTEATGFGVVYTIRESLKHLNMDSSQSTASIQGFGNVSQYAAIGFTDTLGGKVIAVSCWDHKAKEAFTYSKPDGIDPHFLQDITDIYGTIDREKASDAGYQVEDGDSWLSKDVDVLIPAALEAQINKETAEQVSKRVRIIAEGANGPTTPDGEEILLKQDVFFIPDCLCNAGGVTVSYFEGVQNDMNYYWGREEVLDRLNEKMTNAFNSVLQTSLERGVSTRDSSYIVAIDRVVRAMQFRGWV